MKHLVEDNLAAISALMAYRTVDFRIIENIGEYCKEEIGGRFTAMDMIEKINSAISKIINF